MDEKKLIARLAKYDLKMACVGNSLLLKLLSFVYPVVLADQVYIGPGRWDLSSFNMSHEPTRAYVRDHPEALEHLELSTDEAFVTVSAYWGPLASRSYAYTLAREHGAWKVSERILSGMS